MNARENRSEGVRDAARITVVLAILVFVVNFVLIGSMAVSFIAYAALLGALVVLAQLWFVKWKYGR